MAESNILIRNSIWPLTYQNNKFHFGGFWFTIILLLNENEFWLALATTVSVHFVRSIQWLM